MSGKGILNLRDSHCFVPFVMRHYNISIRSSVYNRLEKAYSTPLNPIEISVGLGIFIPIEAFTLSIFIQIVLLNGL